MSLCDECAAIEEGKWDQWDKVDLTGRVALVTGGRVKIG